MALHAEQISIANDIVHTLHGESPDIPYFTYYGVYRTRTIEMRGMKGIYIFTIAEEIQISRRMILDYNAATNWDGSYVGAGFNTPFPEILSVGDVFYIGKVSGVSNSIYQRLRVHLGGRTDSATNGIKMKMPARSFIDGKLDIHVFSFDRTYEEVMGIIIDPVERLLHSWLHPLTGGSQ